MKHVLPLLLCPLLAFGAINNWTNDNRTAYAIGDTNILHGPLTNVLHITNSATFQFDNSGWISNTFTSARITGSALQNVVIDGAVFQCLSNGYNKPFSNSFTAIDISAGVGLEIKNCQFIDLFTRTSNQVDIVNSAGAIVVIGNFTNLSIHNCAITNVGNGIFVNANSGINTNVQIYSNSIWYCSVGISTQPNANYCVKTGYKVWANRINNGTGWDGGDLGAHQECVHMGSASSYAQSNCWSSEELFRNSFGPDCGHWTTSASFSEQYASDTCTNILLAHDNLIVMNPGQIWANGGFSCNSRDAIYANNTVVNGGHAFQANAVSTNNTVGIRYWNNLCVSNGTYILQVGGNPDGWTVLFVKATDYNALVGIDNPWNPGSFTWGGSTDYRDHVTYPQFTTFDNNTTNLASLTLNADYSPPTNSVIVGLGTNLTSLGITTDFNGNARPASGAWTIGAFQSGTNTIAVATNTITQGRLIIL